MAIVRKFGKPDLFVTFTASADWPEIKNSLKPGESSHDRPDIITRVFEMKSQELIDDIFEGNIFGKVVSILAVVEWQKRGKFKKEICRNLNRYYTQSSNFHITMT